jgi:hypothetical protein
MWLSNLNAQELFLISCIIFFGVLAIVLLIVTFLSRLLTVRRVRHENEILPIIENYINEYLFDLISLEEVLNIFNKHPLRHTETFKKALIKSVIVLHSEFRGEYSKKMEELYKESGLINYSINRLKSYRWNKKVEAIRELSNMNCFQFAGNFEALCHHRHPIIAQEALVALIKAKGIKALNVLDEYKGSLNDWMQIYIINTLKKQDNSNIPDLTFLLVHPRAEVVILGLRIVGFYGDSSYIDYIKTLELKTTDARIKYEASYTRSQIEAIMVS